LADRDNQQKESGKSHPIPRNTPTGTRNTTSRTSTAIKGRRRILHSTLQYLVSWLTPPPKKRVSEEKPQATIEKTNSLEKTIRKPTESKIKTPIPAAAHVATFFAQSLSERVGPESRKSKEIGSRTSPKTMNTPAVELEKEKRKRGSERLQLIWRRLRGR
jgi:hypothetical protein